jgi:hypothetical protein
MLADDIVFGGSRYLDSNTGSMNFSLSRVIPSQGLLQMAPASFFPHGLAFTADDRRYAYGFEKIGPGAGLFDLESMSLLETIAPVKDRLFYGHGACSLDGRLLYTTETSPSGEGAIGIRETGSLRYIDDFPSFGSHPHDCHLLDQGTVLAVSNGGSEKSSGIRGSICYIDIESRRLLERIEMPDERFNTGHFYPLDEHRSVVVSAPRRGLGDDHLGAISMQGKADLLDLISAPAEIVGNMFGEALSVLAIPEADLFVVTHPTPGMVTFWQLGSGKLVKRVDLARARGLVLSNDKSSVWISYGPQAELLKLNLSTLEIESQMLGTYITGSHLYSK